MGEKRACNLKRILPLLSSFIAVVIVISSIFLSSGCSQSPTTVQSPTESQVATFPVTTSEPAVSVVPFATPSPSPSPTLSPSPSPSLSPSPEPSLSVLTVTTLDATNITATSATLNGYLTDLGGYTSVQVYFEWSETTDYKRVTEPEIMSSVGSFSADISGLTPNTRWHFRARAVPNIEIAGLDFEFNTLPEPSPIPSPSPSPSVSLPPAPSPDELLAQGFILPQIPRVTCEGLKLLMDIKYNYALVDTRPQQIFDKGHIPGAINIPIALSTEVVNQALCLLPKDCLIIFYCDCSRDNDSANMANRLISLNAGYEEKNIKVLWKGYWRWLELGYPVEE